MKRTMMLVLAAAIAMTAAGVTGANAATVDQRQARQHARIAQGRCSGMLTRAEVKRLRAGQRHVRRLERRAKADGRFTKRERARVHEALDRQSRAIYRLKHNGRRV